MKIKNLNRKFFKYPYGHISRPRLYSIYMASEEIADYIHENVNIKTINLPQLDKFNIYRDVCYFMRRRDFIVKFREYGMFVI